MNSLPDGVRDLLAATLEALDVPFAAADDDRGERQYVRLLQLRAAHLRGALDAVLDLSARPDIAARVVRQATADTPVTYRVHAPAGKDTSGADQAPAGESTQPAACGRCRTPFDPADTRWDGPGRYGKTPWCRRCVDNCHEAGADHRCVICR